jgi:DNA-directed RNA polymerase specialized sigma24 family protein
MNEDTRADPVDSAPGSISQWLSALQAGNRNAVQPLWERFFQRLVGVARQRLQHARRQAADEEDVALSALDTFFRNAEAGRFPQITDSHDLWQLLIVITERKARSLARREGRAKRGGGRVLDQCTAGSDDTGTTPFDQILDRELDPAFIAQFADEYHRLLRLLKDDELRSIAVWRMEGHTIEEIAHRLECVPRTIDRRLRLVRAVWEKEFVP